METGAVIVRTNSNARVGGGAVLGDESSVGTSPKALASAAKAEDSASSCS